MIKKPFSVLFGYSTAHISRLLSGDVAVVPRAQAAFSLKPKITPAPAGGVSLNPWKQFLVTAPVS